MKRFEHQEGEKGHYEEIGKKIGYAIDRYIDWLYFDLRTRAHRDEGVSTAADHVNGIRVTIGRSGFDSIQSKNREREPWLQIIALLDIADKEYGDRDIPARLDEINTKNKEIISANAAERKAGR